jgi:hypothetical protein
MVEPWGTPRPSASSGRIGKDGRAGVLGASSLGDFMIGVGGPVGGMPFFVCCEPKRACLQRDYLLS